MTRATAATPATDVVARVHESLAKAPSQILTATLDDAMAVEERPNMPATNDEWPNWRLALPEPIETLSDNRLASRIAKALRRKPVNRSVVKSPSSNVRELQPLPALIQIGQIANPNAGREGLGLGSCAALTSRGFGRSASGWDLGARSLRI